MFCFEAKERFPCEWSIKISILYTHHRCKLYFPAALNLVSNCPEGPECDAREKSEQTAALPSIYLTVFLSNSVFQSHTLTCLSLNLPSFQLSFSVADQKNPHYSYLFSYVTAGEQYDQTWKAERSREEMSAGRVRGLHRFRRWHACDLYVLPEEWRKMRKLKPGHVFPLC